MPAGEGRGGIWCSGDWYVFVEPDEKELIFVYRLLCLSGAGWGGCMVALVDEARVPEFIENIKAAYSPYHGLHGAALSEVIFPTKPSSGASGASCPTRPSPCGI